MRAVARFVAAMGFLGLLWTAQEHAQASDTPVQFDVPLAPYCLNGTYPLAVRSGTVTTQGTLELHVTATGGLSGTLTLGADVYALTGKQAVKGKSLAVTLTGTGANASTVKLAGATKNGQLAGSISGKGGTIVLKPKSIFAANVETASALVARCALNVTSDDATGVLSGTGTTTICGVQTPVTLTGKSKFTNALTATSKPATAALTLTGASFKWSGKGPVVIEDEGPGGPGYVVTWSASSGGVKSKGKNLRVAPTPPVGPSPGKIVLTGAVATSFNTWPIDVTLQVVDAKPSGNPADFTITNNGTPVTTGIQLNAAAATIKLVQFQLTGDSGKNELQVTGKDSSGLNLTGTVTVWSGFSTLVITVKDEQGQPVPSAATVVKLGDDQNVSVSGTTDASGQLTLQNMPDRTVIIEATGPANSFGTKADVGSAGSIDVVIHGFDQPSAIDNDDFATGDASGWTTGTSPATVVAHVEDAGPTKVGGDSDLRLATSGEGTQKVSRTIVTGTNAVAVKLRYRFQTTEVPGGYFGTKWNDSFSVSIRTKNGGGVKTESNTMNGLGLAAFDAAGSTKWREVALPLTNTGDTVQIDVTVANVGDALYDSYVYIDKIQVISLDLKVKEASRILLETNKFEIVVSPPGNGSAFKIEIRRASNATWFLIGNNQVEDNYKQRVAGTFKLRGKAMINGKEETTQEKDLVVQFPSYADIVGNGTVQTMTDAAWTSTKAAANAATRREEGFFILLNTNTGVETYQKTATVLGPLVGPAATGSVNIAKPADNPAAPTPIQSAIYAVASFHTHTPTAFRPVGRAVGPSAADQTADTNDDVPGVVYDYTGNAAGNAPARHPIDSAAQRYHSGPNRRTTPP